MASGRFYKIKIGSVWLTDDGTDTGRPCKSTVPGDAALLVLNTGNVAIGADGTPFREMPLTPTGAGRAFQVKAAFMTKAVYDDLKAALDAAAAASDHFNVTGDGTPGSFDVDVIVADNPQYIAAESFSAGNLKNVTMSFITTAIN